MNLKKLIYTTLTVCIFSACGKKQAVSPINNTTNPAVDVYVTGGIVASTGFSEATYWKNGIAVKLVTDSSSNSGATSIAVSGNNICVAGYATINGTETQVYWKNGIMTQLPDAEMQLLTHNIAINGDDVYVVGSTYQNQTFYAAYWKNGVVNILPSTGSSSTAQAIFINGSDIYIAGTAIINVIDYATYWKNGVATVFPQVEAQATDITVSGNDVYIADNGVAYWKNGVFTQLAFGNNITGAITNGIAVSGNTVYLSGFVTGNNENIATYWKNDITTNASSQVSLSNTSVSASNYTSIAINGSDLYIAGLISNNNNCYWKNGTLIPLTEKTNSGFVYGLAIIPR
jgi:hypothetical protein